MTLIRPGSTLADVSVNPNPSGLPGSNVAQQLLNGFAFWGLLAAVAGVIISAIVYAVSSHSANPHYASRGKTGALAGFVAALLIGAAAGLVNFGYHAGSGIH